MQLYMLFMELRNEVLPNLMVAYQDNGATVVTVGSFEVVPVTINRY